MTIQVGMFGAAIQIQGGEYVFCREADPGATESAISVPIGGADYLLISNFTAADIQVNDPGLALPIVAGEAGILSFVDLCQVLPYTVSPGVATKTVALNYTESLGKIEFFWNGSGTVYLSGASGSRTNLAINDTLIISSPRGSITQGANPSYNNYIQLSGVDGGQGLGNLIRSGINVIEVKLKNVYGTTTGCNAIYLIKV
jgi:hypothetical protein